MRPALMRNCIRQERMAYVRHKGVFFRPADREENMRDDLKKAAVWLLTAAVILASAGCSTKKGDGLKELQASGAEVQEELTDTKGEEKAEDFAFVYVCGEVHSPGVYELKSGSRVFEAIEMAGGVTEDAAYEAINQARTVEDGEQIYVPSREEAKEYAAGTQSPGVGVTGSKGTDTKGKININTAGKEELMTLTGIGEAKAESILSYREEHGSFGDIEELMQIEGIKEGVFNKIKDDITI